MILAKCIFSQSATGEVSSAYFRKLAISREEEGDEEEEEEGEEEEEEEPQPEFDSSGDEIPYVKRSRRR